MTIRICMILSFSSDILLICLFFSIYSSSNFMLKFTFPFSTFLSPSVVPNESVFPELSSASPTFLFLLDLLNVFESLLYFWYIIWWLTSTCCSSSSNSFNEGNWYSATSMFDRKQRISSALASSQVESVGEGRLWLNPFCFWISICSYIFSLLNLV